jgi:predicted nucleic-acid-binding protein
LRAIDTNILVQYFLGGDSEQAEAAAAVIEGGLETKEPLLIASHILCELTWVFRATFKMAKADLVQLLEQILTKTVFVFEREYAVRRALEQYRRGPADFSDYLLGQIAIEMGCRDTVTFDKALRGASGFTLL